MDAILRQCEHLGGGGRDGRFIGHAGLLFSLLLSAVLLLIGFRVYQSGLKRMESASPNWIDVVPLFAMGFTTLLLLAVAVVELGVYRNRARQSASRAEVLGEIMNAFSLKLEADRKALSSRLHDDVGGGLTAVKLEVESLQRSRSLDPGDWSRCYAHFNTLLQHVRGISRMLYPNMIGVLGIGDVLKEMVEQLNTGGMEIHLDVGADIGALDETLSVCILRIVQESVVNAVRHSSGSKVSISVMRDGATVCGHVDDDGVGWCRDNPGMGLTLMRERVAGLKGALEFLASPAGGARVRFSMPLQERASE